MSGRASYQLRFCVGQPKGPKAGVWRLWTARPPKSDVYVAARGAASSMKMSLHESGAWQASFTSQFADTLQAKNEWFREYRHIDKWDRPIELSPGLTLALRLIFPASELRTYSLDLGTSKPTTWIPAPLPGLVCEIALVFSRLEVPVSNWPGKSQHGTQLLARHSLPNGAWSTGTRK